MGETFQLDFIKTFADYSFEQLTNENSTLYFPLFVEMTKSSEVSNQV